jgi:hypothetical protein
MFGFCCIRITQTVQLQPEALCAELPRQFAKEFLRQTRSRDLYIPYFKGCVEGRPDLDCIAIGTHLSRKAFPILSAENFC